MPDCPGCGDEGVYQTPDETGDYGCWNLACRVESFNESPLEPSG